MRLFDSFMYYDVVQQGADHLLVYDTQGSGYNTARCCQARLTKHITNL